MALSKGALSNILSTRWLTLSIGQATNGWWSCNFLGPTGERFLSTPFPRSAFWAALHASTIAAARHHDEKIGTGGTVHLFRLGFGLETQIRQAVLKDSWRPDDSIQGNKASWMAALKNLAEKPDSPISAGPIRISAPDIFTGPKTLGKVAGIYLSAFESGIETLPYGADK